MHGHAVVVGGGISGLLAALLLARRGSERVVLVERESEPGGLLRCFDYGPFGRFDYGMHNMYESGIEELDSLLFGLLPKDEWQLLEGNKRDLAGLFYRGSLQRHSPYPDLRSLPPEQAAPCIASLLAAAAAQAPLDVSNAYAYARSRFGQPIADLVIGPSVERLYGHPATDMDVMATMITTMGRVVAFEEQPFLAMMNTDGIRERIAYPEQRHLPKEHASGRRAYYPRKYGMYRLVQALLALLKELGVEVALSATVRRVEVRDSSIASLTVAEGKNERNVGDVRRLVWTSGLPTIAPLLGVPMQDLAFDRPRRTVVVNFLISKPLATGDLYYFYCYDPGFLTFRVTNYAAYCEGAPRAGGFPLSVELLVDGAEADPDAMEIRALDELRRFGVLAEGTEILFKRAEVLASGFPMPTTKNTRALGTLREAVHGLALSNLDVLGILSEPGLFFQRDVVAQTFLRIHGVSS